jgi:hypothetical protein
MELIVTEDYNTDIHASNNRGIFQHRCEICHPSMGTSFRPVTCNSQHNHRLLASEAADATPTSFGPYSHE